MKEEEMRANSKQAAGKNTKPGIIYDPVTLPTPILSQLNLSL